MKPNFIPIEIILSPSKINELYKSSFRKGNLNWLILTKMSNPIILNGLLTNNITKILFHFTAYFNF